MAVAAALNVNVAANTANFSKGMSRAKSELTDFQKSVNLAKAGLAAFGAGFTAAAAVGFLKDSVNAFEQAYQQQQKLSAVLVATGHAAGFSKQQLNEYASAIQATTNYDDDAVAGAQAVLATFKEIKGARFTEATSAILDLSAVMGQDLQSSAVQVGKALNDPIRGMTALRRVGVSFTEQQVDMVKQMVAANDVVGAQKLILAELKSEFGGAAAAQRSELKGLANDWGDLKESVGAFSHTETATSGLQVVSSAIRDSTASLTNFNQALSEGKGLLGAYREAVLKTPILKSLLPEGAATFGKVSPLVFGGAGFSSAPNKPSQDTSAIASQAPESEAQAAKLSDAIEMTAAKLRDQADAAGKSAAAIAIMKFEQQGATAEQLSSLRALDAEQSIRKSISDATAAATARQEAQNASVKSFIDEMEKEAALFGKTGKEAELLKRNIEGLTEAQHKHIDALILERKHQEFEGRQIDRQAAFDKRNTQREGDRQQQMADEFKALEEKFKTPQQKLDDELASIKAKRDAGFDATASGRAVLDKAEAEARKNFADETKTPTVDRTRGNEALLKGSGKDFSAIFQAPGGMSSRDSAEKTRKQQLVELRASRKAAEETAKAIKNGQVVAVGASPQ